MNGAAFLAAIAKFLPLIFAVGFLAPLISQSLTAIGWSAPFGDPLFGLAMAIVWGLIAQIKGRWI